MVLVHDAAWDFGPGLKYFASQVAVLNEASGEQIPIYDWEPPWNPFAQPHQGYFGVVVTQPRQLENGSWECIAKAGMVVGKCLAGEVQLAFDSDALRGAMEAVDKQKDDPMSTVPIGGLTAKSTVLRVPEPKIEPPGASDKPPQSGAVPAPGGRVGSGE